MRADARTMLTALLLGGCTLLAACGGEEKGGNTVQMKDLEVVDGTTTDAMTDLDGVQSEVPATAEPSAPAANGTETANQTAPAANAAQPDAEVVTDQ